MNSFYLLFFKTVSDIIFAFTCIFLYDILLSLQVIDAHRRSVKCLFVDEWHFLSGDCNGQVMAWSVSCGTQQCLMTFNHPK